MEISHRLIPLYERWSNLINLHVVCLYGIGGADSTVGTESAANCSSTAGGNLTSDVGSTVYGDFIAGGNSVYGGDRDSMGGSSS